ncbi:OLC1v1035421C1 [Oldenlandia corymbosa var. corymbosa]|uniref:OLC1v1035421C1 n=1 Tax=Oldenlandia corymbosa var. corymbosa TaxID=529605 RepID=A0AAV1CW99_OLDCO|nr:OLC1v1035421C1 [Oldenlandia corymbosa var. corymbosa]
MAIIRDYMGMARVFRWRLNRPSKFNHGGAFLIRARTIFSPKHIITKRDETDVVVTVPFLAGDRQRFLDFNSTKELLREALVRLILVGSCPNLDALAQRVAEELFCSFRFSPQFLNRGDTKLVFVLDLNVYVERKESDHYRPETIQWITAANEQFRKLLEDGGENFPEEIKEIEDYLKNKPERIHQLELKKGLLHEVLPALEVDRISEVVVEKNTAATFSDHHRAQVKVCPICLESLSKGDEFVVKAPCNHVFHRSCIFNCLIRTDSCPICRTSFKISV